MGEEGEGWRENGMEEGRGEGGRGREKGREEGEGGALGTSASHPLMYTSHQVMCQSC